MVESGFDYKARVANVNISETADLMGFLFNSVCDYFYGKIEIFCITTLKSHNVMV